MKPLSLITAFGLITAFVMLGSSAFAQIKPVQIKPAQTKPVTYDLAFHLSLREKFYTSFLETQQDMNNLEKLEALKMWKELKAKEIPKFNAYITTSLKNVIRSQAVIDWFAHYQLTGQFGKSAAVVSAYFYALNAFLWEAGTNPRGADAATKQMAYALAASSLQTVRNIENCMHASTRPAGKALNALTTIVSACVTADQGAQKMLAAAQQIMNTRKYMGPNQVLSLSGYIPGNKVEQLTQNHYEADFIRYLAPMTSAVQKNYAGMSVDDFKSKMTFKAAALNSFFTAAEGFPESPAQHRNWSMLTANGKKNIFGSVFNALENAQESIFIDVFFLGGSVGASLAKHLIKQVQKKPNLWIYIINDRFNPLSYENEMAPVYNYLRAYSENFPEDRLIIMTPRIDLKRTAFPPLAENIINDQTLKYILSDSSQAELKSQLGFYPKGKSDHSKVIVVDGKNKDLGIAFVGSKNFTDSSGAVAYDEVTKIQGPAVPVILDSYYYDLLEALKEVQRLSPTHFSALLTKNSIANGSASGDALEDVRQLLSSVDVLNRAAGKAKADLQWPVAGATTVSIGENNVYGTIRTALPQDIALINSAEKQIIISDQFLYDPLIIRALLEKIQKTPQLKVYIMLAAMKDELDPTKKFAHIPNISYIDGLKATGQVIAKWKKVPAADLEALKEVKQKYAVKLAAEYHLKAISIDGVGRVEAALCTDIPRNYQALVNSMTEAPALVSGSANKDVLTMTGGFREFQVVVYDRMATISHDCQFWERFNDPNQSSDIKNETMNLPPELSSHGIDEALFNQIIRNAINIAYGAVTGYFTN